MTEQEAKTKWCPFARGITDSGGNRMAFGSSGDEPDNDDCRAQYAVEMADLYPCIGSACMAWRWGYHTMEGYDHVIGAPKTITWTPESKKYGFCGLASKP